MNRAAPHPSAVSQIRALFAEATAAWGAGRVVAECYCALAFLGAMFFALVVIAAVLP